jgi:hypothetical protein
MRQACLLPAACCPLPAACVVPMGSRRNALHPENMQEELQAASDGYQLWSIEQQHGKAPQLMAPI